MEKWIEDLIRETDIRRDFPLYRDPSSFASVSRKLGDLLHKLGPYRRDCFEFRMIDDLEPDWLENPLWWKEELSRGTEILMHEKMGGLPYLPQGMSYPRDSAGDCQFLLAQMDLSRMSGFRDWPGSGLLQFFVRADLSEMEFTDSGKQVVHPACFEVRYHPAPDSAAAQTDFAFLKLWDNTPIDRTFKLESERKTTTLSSTDYRFENDPALAKLHGEFLRDDPEFTSLYGAVNRETWNMKMEGYPAFTTPDPRELAPGMDVLLLQAPLNFASAAPMAYFFIRPEDLARLDFSKTVLVIQNRY